MMTQKQPLPYGWFIITLIVLITYTLPWVIGGSASLSFGAFDLAEWASLHPASRAMSPILLTSFLLRFPLVALAWVISFNAPISTFRSSAWWGYAIICLFLVLLSSPPLEFLTTNRDDINYLQQAGLTLLAFIGCGIGLSGVLKPYRGYIAIGVCLMGVISSILGMWQGYNLLIDFQINTSVGFGIIGCVSMFAIMGIYTWMETLKRRR